MCDGLVGELRLIFNIGHVQVHIVIGQLVLDVERCVVARIICIWIKRARSVDSVRVRVDVEVTADGARDGIDTLIGRSWCFLLTVRSVGDHIQRQLLAQVVVGIDVGCVALHGTL